MWRSIAEWFWRADSWAIGKALVIQSFLRTHLGPQRMAIFLWCNRLVMVGFGFCLFWQSDARWWEYVLWITLGVFGFAIMLLIAFSISVLITLTFFNRLDGRGMEIALALICWLLVTEGLALLALAWMMKGGWRILAIFLLYQLGLLVYAFFAHRGGNQPPRRRKRVATTSGASLWERLTQVVPYGA